MEAHEIKVQRTARYYTLGEANSNTQYLWIVCHGYGQLAKHFIRKFDAIQNDQTLILAPEGLSKFYWEGPGSRNPVASWMTREDRLNEIQDYSDMIYTLYQKYKEQCAEDVKIILFGFSQGCATQVRWMLNKFPHFHTLVLWAGLFPEDLNYIPHKEYLEDKKLHFVYGDKDIFLTEERQKEHEELMAKNQLNVSTKKFEGPHKVIRSILSELAEEVYQSY